jgi:hypothetical protein
MPMYCINPKECHYPTKCLTLRNFVRWKQCHCPTKCLTLDSYPLDAAFLIDEAKTHAVMMMEWCLHCLANEIVPFEDYASKYWLDHGRNSSADSISTDAFLELFLHKVEKGIRQWYSYCLIREQASTRGKMMERLR